MGRGDVPRVTMKWWFCAINDRGMLSKRHTQGRNRKRLLRRNRVIHSPYDKASSSVPIPASHRLPQLGETTNDSEPEESAVDVDASSRVVLAGAGAAARAASAAGAGSGILVRGSVVAGAGEGTLDLATTTVAAEALEGLARGRDVRGGRGIKGTLDVVQGRELDARRCVSHFIGDGEPGMDMQQSSLLGKVAPELDGTANALHLGESVDLIEVRVVGDQETAANAGEHGEGDVGQTGVANERDIARRSRGQVGSAERGEVVRVETSGSVNGDKRGSAEVRHVGNGHVGNPDEVGQRDLQVLTVGLDVQVVREIAKLGGKVGETAVVVDVHGSKRLDIDTVQAAQEGVGNDDARGLGNTTGEGETAESRERGPRDAADAAELGEGQSGQHGDVVQGESTANGGEAASSKGGDQAVVGEREVTSDGLKTTEIDGTDSGGSDNHVTLDGRAGRAEGSGLSRAGDGRSGAADAGLSLRRETS